MIGRKGPDFVFSGAVDEGNSGGPVVYQGKVVGVVMQAGNGFGNAVPSPTVRFTLEGWKVPLGIARSVAGKGQTSTPTMNSQSEKSLPTTITGKDGAPMVLVSAGAFTMGSPDGEGGSDEHPQHTVDLDAFYIDQYEVTVERYKRLMIQKNRANPDYWDQVKLSRDGQKPVVGIDWNDAQAYCEWAGKRLPTEAEWEKAARGTDKRTYPWGESKPNSSTANFGKDWSDQFYDERIKPVGTYERGKSPYGAYDMAGNVWEWVADWYDKDYYQPNHPKNPQGPSSGDLKVLRGGSWGSYSSVLRSANRLRSDPANRFAGNGVRCAQDAR
jgi:formylglycine-generating enzyme required for sulfatase activity